jgi:hypothetical protein
MNPAPCPQIIILQLCAMVSKASLEVELKEDLPVEVECKPP